MPWKDARKNKAYIREYGRKWRLLHPGFRRKYTWRIRGADANQAGRIYDSSSECAISSTLLKGSRKHLDHDHSTKRIRGVLCKDCNQAIGLFHEDRRIILNAVKLSEVQWRNASAVIMTPLDMERRRRYLRNYERTHTDQRRRIHHRAECRAYGLDVEECERIYGNTAVCDICGTPFGGKKQKCLDHDHITNKVRGVLCAACNFAIGLMKDDWRLLSRGLAYLYGL